MTTLETSNFEKFDIEALDAEFKELDAELFELAFLEDDFSPENEDILAELNQELSEIGLGEGLEANSLSSLAENEVEAAFLIRWLKTKAAKLIKKLYELIRKYYSKLKECIPLLKETIAAFKSGKYISAIRKGVKTYKCIRNCLR
ncbi:MAG: hypothetical protein AAF757_22590 [Cyanobacteria bacterium P01_D01_bin.116]